jgi:hypothetical protein
VSKFTVSPALAAPGQFVNFVWAASNATAFDVAPQIALDDQTLPLMARPYWYNTNGLSQTTTFQAIASAGSTASAPVTATLIIIPVTLRASAATVPGGQPVTLRYTGPNNNSTWVLNSSSSDTPIPLNPICNGDSCSGIYQTGALAASTTFSVAMTGPAPTGGQAFSPNVIVNVQQPTTLSFKAQSQTVRSGGTVALSWATRNASSITIDHGIGQVQLTATGSY